MPKPSNQKEPAAPPQMTARSALLAPMPRYRAEGRRSRVITRIVCTAALLGGVIAFARAVRSKAFGNGPTAEALYRAHDTIYLPLKAYTFTLFFPSSLVWFGLAATFLVLWLAFFLADRSLVRQPHIALLQRSVGIRQLRVPFVTTARLLLRGGYSPDMLIYVAEHQRDMCFDQVAAGENKAQRLAVLTRLLIDLALLRADDQIWQLRAACYWQRGVLLLQMRDAPVATSLAPYIVPTCIRSLRSFGLSPLDALNAQVTSFDTIHCMTDALRLALLLGAPSDILGESYSPDLETVTEKKAVMRGMFWSAEWRRERIDHLRSRLEAALIYTSASGALSADPFPPDALPEALPLLGQLALGSALAAAYQTATPQRARSTLESIEALQFVVACLAPNASGGLPELINRSRAWAGNLPTPIDYRIAASLGVAADQEVAQTWSQYVDTGTSAIRRADLHYAVARTEDLFQAAGISQDTNVFDQQHNETA